MPQPSAINRAIIDLPDTIPLHCRTTRASNRETLAILTVNIQRLFDTFCIKLAAADPHHQLSH